MAMSHYRLQPRHYSYFTGAKKKGDRKKTACHLVTLSCLITMDSSHDFVPY